MTSNSTQFTKTTGDRTRGRVPKGRFCFLETDWVKKKHTIPPMGRPCRLSHVPISRLEAQINRAIPKGQLGPSRISAKPGVWPGTTPAPKPAVRIAASVRCGSPFVPPWLTVVVVASGQTMSSSKSLTQKWLRQNIAAYNDGNRVFADIDATLSLYPTLRPKTEVYSSVICLERSLTVRSSLPFPPSL